MKVTSLVAAAAFLAGASATAEAEDKRAVYGVCAVGFGGPCNGDNDPGNFNWPGNFRTLQSQRENKKARREEVSKVAKRQAGICAVGAGGPCNGEDDPGNFGSGRFRLPGTRFPNVDIDREIARRQYLPDQRIGAGLPAWFWDEAAKDLQGKAKRDAQLCAIGYGGSCNGGAPAWRGLLPVARPGGELAQRDVDSTFAKRACAAGYEGYCNDAFIAPQFRSYGRLAQRDVGSTFAKRACAAGYEGFCNDAFLAPPQGFDEELLRNSARPVQIASKRQVYAGGSKEWAERQAQVQELYRLASGRQ
ncbi:hypothetical protein CB0940_05388 [Cercospora beticola]|uniref:Uncharacterized protein n=1 Tax=Cercospora beticola TaxID=122368 RepID=A0A2G5HYI1_CERBT|nr:hypothetical protein CB0940_05388 [Cercospora beticola]PIA97580.1 hypothetical protein CB0940_05388 [Cercospora beticola]WPA97929.1 hypothetical protein RHO25_002540 [Cercospora beticola]CAK1359129.1 unnamed protein product [Cercospora beticola]